MKYLLFILLVTSNLFATETRTKIAVIDSGIVEGELLSYLCKDGHKDFTGKGWNNDVQKHGSLVADIISQYINPSKQCLLIIKYTHDGLADTLQTFNDAIKYAIEQQVTYINLSSSGVAADDEERKILELALAHRIRVVVSAGNNSQNLSLRCNSFPACYKFHSYNFFVVGALNHSGSRLSVSNYNGPVNHYENGLTVCADNIKNTEFRVCKSGTSMSAALFTAKLVKKENR